jgi:hypothetical protein
MRQICNYGGEIIQPPPIMEGVNNATEKLKNNKSQGVDTLQAELLKYGGKEMVKNTTYYSSNMNNGRDL